MVVSRSSSASRSSSSKGSKMATSTAKKASPDILSILFNIETFTSLQMVDWPNGSDYNPVAIEDLMMEEEQLKLELLMSLFSYDFDRSNCLIYHKSNVSVYGGQVFVSDVEDEESPLMILFGTPDSSNRFPLEFEGEGVYTAGNCRLKLGSQEQEILNSTGGKVKVDIPLLKVGQNIEHDGKLYHLSFKIMFRLNDETLDTPEDYVRLNMLLAEGDLEEAAEYLLKPSKGGGWIPLKNISMPFVLSKKPLPRLEYQIEDWIEVPPTEGNEQYGSQVEITFSSDTPIEFAIDKEKEYPRQNVIKVRCGNNTPAFSSLVGNKVFSDMLRKQMPSRGVKLVITGFNKNPEHYPKHVISFGYAENSFDYPDFFEILGIEDPNAETEEADFEELPSMPTRKALPSAEEEEEEEEIEISPAIAKAQELAAKMTGDGSTITKKKKTAKTVY